MDIIVRLPDKITCNNKWLYLKSSKELCRKLRACSVDIDHIIAVGTEDSKPLWPGKKRINPFDFSENRIKGHEHALVIGLDAPFLSKNTLKKMLEHHDGHDDVGGFNSSAVCTFRKTPEQKNIAAMEHGGRMAFILTYSNGVLNQHMETHDPCQYDDDEDDGIDIAFRFPQKRIHISAPCELHFIISDSDRKNQQSWNSESHAKHFYDRRITYSKENNNYDISFLEECMIQIIKVISKPRLYSKIHYGQAPVTVNDLIGLDENQTRINLNNLEKIAGRQAFPNLYEPFLGMALLKQSELIDFIMKGDQWFETQKKLKPLIVNEKESRLISEDTVFIVSDWELIQKITMN